MSGSCDYLHPGQISHLHECDVRHEPRESLVMSRGLCTDSSSRPFDAVRSESIDRSSSLDSLLTMPCGRCRTRNLHCGGDSGNGTACQNCREVGRPHVCQFYKPGTDFQSQRKLIAITCDRCRVQNLQCSGDSGDGSGCQNCRRMGIDPKTCQFHRVESSETIMGLYQPMTGLCQPEADFLDINGIKNSFDPIGPSPSESANSYKLSQPRQFGLGERRDLQWNSLSRSDCVSKELVRPVCRDIGTCDDEDTDIFYHQRRLIDHWSENVLKGVCVTMVEANALGVLTRMSIQDITESLAKRNINIETINSPDTVQSKPSLKESEPQRSFNTATNSARISAQIASQRLRVCMSSAVDYKDQRPRIEEAEAEGGCDLQPKQDQISLSCTNATDQRSSLAAHLANSEVQPVKIEDDAVHSNSVLFEYPESINRYTPTGTIQEHEDKNESPVSSPDVDLSTDADPKTSEGSETRVPAFTTSDVSYLMQHRSLISDYYTGNSVDIISERKEVLLDQLMIQFYEMFDDAGFYEHGSDGSSPSSASSQSSSLPDSNKRGKRRKGEEKGEDGKPDDEDDAPFKRQRRPKDTLDPSDKDKRKLACPYFKHDPRKYRNCRSCLGPGWDTVHRLKEHLYRRHSLPPQCLRCYQSFTSEAHLKEHMRASDGCTVKEQEPLEGLDKTQIEQLKSRQSMFRAGSEEAKWRIVYLILFPDTTPSAIPSPYYDDDVGLSSSHNNSPASLDLMQYEAYLSRELPRSVRKEFELAIQKLMGPIEETLKNQLESIVRNCTERLSRTYQQNADNAARLSPRLKSSEMATDAISNGPASLNRMPDALAQYAVPPDSSLETWAGIGSFSDSNGGLTTSDSAYHSGSDPHDMTSTLPNDIWWLSGLGDIPIISGNNEPLEYTEMMSGFNHQTTLSYDVIPQHNGKGKAKMKEPNVCI